MASMADELKVADLLRQLQAFSATNLTDLLGMATGLPSPQALPVDTPPPCSSKRTHEITSDEEHEPVNEPETKKAKTKGRPKRTRPRTPWHQVVQSPF